MYLRFCLFKVLWSIYFYWTKKGCYVSKSFWLMKRDSKSFLNHCLEFSQLSSFIWQNVRFLRILFFRVSLSNRNSILNWFFCHSRNLCRTLYTRIALPILYQKAHRSTWKTRGLLVANWHYGEAERKISCLSTQYCFSLYRALLEANIILQKRNISTSCYPFLEI